MCINEIGSSIRAEVSPGKIGDGLFPPTVDEIEDVKVANVDSEAGLSSEEENLIAQTTSEIRNILGDKARPAFMSRFMMVPDANLNDESREEGSGSNGQNCNSSSEDCASETAAAAGFRPRLSIFNDITKRSAGKSNETRKADKPVDVKMQCFFH